MRKCKKCQRILPIDNFYKNSVAGSREYRSHTCKSCSNKIRLARERKRRPYPHEQFRRKKKWTKEEILYLIDNMDQDNETLGYKLGRSWLSIQKYKYKIKKENISRESLTNEKEYSKCTRCNKIKPVDEFTKNKNLLNKISPYCKSCTRKLSLDMYKNKYSNIPPKEKRFRAGMPWSVKEVNYIKNNMDKSIIDIAYKLGRSYNSISDKRIEIMKEGEI